MSETKYKIGLAGEINYQAAIEKCTVGMPVLLLPDFENPHDSRAIAAMTDQNETIGYLPRDGWLTEAILEDRKLPMCFVHSIAGEPGRLGVVCEVQLVAGGPDWYEIAAAQGHDLSPSEDEEDDGWIDADEFLKSQSVITEAPTIATAPVEEAGDAEVVHPTATPTPEVGKRYPIIIGLIAIAFVLVALFLVAASG